MRFSVASLIAAFLFVVSVGGTANADLILNANYVDSGAGSWTATKQAVVDQAIADWQSVISGIDDGAGGVADVTVNFDVTFANVSNGYLGQWQGGFSAAAGTDIRPWTSGVNHTIRFNTFWESGSNQLWYDPTPGDDGSDKAFADWDALTVARHEIGHMLGFTSLYRDNFATGSESFPWVDLIENDIFDPSGLNVAMEPGDSGHVLENSLLMDTQLSNAEGRIGISNTELEMLSLAYGYTLTTAAVPEPGSCLILGLGAIGVVFYRRR